MRFEERRDFKMIPQNLTVRTSEELVQVLRAVDITVSPCGKGRKSSQVETWSICRFLATFAYENFFSYPLEIEHADKPDLRIHELVDNENERCIGVEVVEAVKENFAKASAIYNRNGSKGLIDLTHFKWGVPRMLKQEIKEIIDQDKPMGPGWGGDSPEREWAQAMKDTILNKIAALNKDGFTRFRSNWLLVYDNLALPGVDRAKSMEFLAATLDEENYWENKPERSFEIIFVESPEKFLFLKQNDFGEKTLVDLWS